METDFGVAGAEDKPGVDEIDNFLNSDPGMLLAGDPPLTPRQRKQLRKGLPSVDDLRKLAQTWLDQAYKFYPDLAKAGVVSPSK